MQDAADQQFSLIEVSIYLSPLLSLLSLKLVETFFFFEKEMTLCNVLLLFPFYKLKTDA